MSDPVSYLSTSGRHGLPFLFAGQAQREFFVNEALTRIDILLHPTVLGESASPPPDPTEGDCWLIAESATGAWSGREGEIACSQGGGWAYCPPAIGMVVRDLSRGGLARFDGSWMRLARPAAPGGGAVVDVESRAAIEALLNLLDAFGIFSSS